MNKLYLFFVAAMAFVVVSNAHADDVKAEQLKSTAEKLKNIANNLPAGAAASGVAEAATLAEEASKKAAASPKDNNDWTGDHLQIRGNLKELKQAGGDQNKKFFAPAYVRFNVSKDRNGIVNIAPRDNFTCNTGKVHVKPAAKHNLYGNIANLSTDDGTTIETAVTNCNEVIAPYETYTISKSEVENIPYVRYGWTFGALVVPFKYQSHSKTINFAPSYQLYAGYRRDSNGSGNGPFLSAGIATADVPKGSGQSESKQGFSYGFGWIFEIKKNSGFQIVTMVGQDRFGANSGYEYEGKTWYSVSFGFALDPSANK